MRVVSRRRFGVQSMAASAGVAMAGLAMPAVHAQPRSGPQYRTALIGTGWWGTNILREALRAGQSRLVGLCDVDPSQRAACQREIQGLTADEPRLYSDFRELLAREKPEVCIVATPDHWHPLITIAAVEAGAHVYVEKPIAHTIDEGKAMVKAARATGRVVQVGTHRRVSPHNVEGMKFLRDGKAGRIGMVRAFVHYGGGRQEPRANEDVPDGLDWEMYCGPAPLRPFNRAIHPKGFRGFLDYANGTLGDWGIHWMDQILWIMQRDAPQRVFSTGGRPIAGPPVNDGRAQTPDAPDHQIAAFEFGDFSVSWEHRQFAANNAEKARPEQESVGCYFYGTEGTFHMGWQDGWTFYPADGKKAPVHMAPTLHEPDQQNIRELWANLLECIPTGARPVSDIETGHRSTTMSLLGMLSMKLGRSLEWDAEQQLVRHDDEANAHLRRAYRGEWEYPSAG